MNFKRLPFFLIFFTLIYACQNTTQSDHSDASMTVPTMQEESALATTPSSSNGYSTSTNVSPPIQQVNVPTRHFKVRTHESQTIEIKETGSSIVIPANAFVDENGELIQGEVDIQFKEYHDIGDILASGIPMRMTSPNGGTGYMQSAGMFDIQGSYGGKGVFIAENKTLEVNLASNYNDATYDFWKFEKGEKQWMNRGPSEARVNESKQKALKRIAKTKTIEKPIIPYKFDKNKPVLEFDINYDNFPELKEMNGILWQYAGSDDSKNPVKNKWIYQEDWDAAEIEAFPSGNLYKLILKNKYKEFSTVVSPSQSGAEFEKSMAEYSRKQGEYEANKLTVEDLKTLAREQADFLRTASINGFGIYNYDLMMKDEDFILVDAKFDFGTMIPGIHKLTKVYMIVDNRNVVCYPANDWGKIRIDPSVSTKMMAILPGQKYATISEDEFKGIINDIRAAEGNKTYTFKMNFNERLIASLDDLKDAIKRLV